MEMLLMNTKKLTYAQSQKSKSPRKMPPLVKLTMLIKSETNALFQLEMPERTEMPITPEKLSISETNSPTNNKIFKSSPGENTPTDQSSSNYLAFILFI
jgi:hypothetical protein